MFWAWEARHDLRSFPPGQAGVAFLAASFFLQDDGVRFRPRMQPLRVTPGTFMMAVVRIEEARDGRSLSEKQVRILVDSIEQVVKTTGSRAVQVDFDARDSELAAFRALIDTLRVRLDTRTFLSVTALASWCEGSWPAAVAADEVVPMLFRMGPDGRAILEKLRSRGFRSAACAKSIGVSLDEPWPDVRGYQRIYVFSGIPAWTPELARRVLDRLARERRP